MIDGARFVVCGSHFEFVEFVYLAVDMASEKNFGDGGMNGFDDDDEKVEPKKWEGRE